METKTTQEIKEWNPIRAQSHNAEMLVRNKKWIAVEDLIEWLNNNSNPCMKCGSVQCAICSNDLMEELK